MIVEKRKHERLALEDMSSRLFRSDGTEIDYCPINVSSNGFSIYTSVLLPVGTEVTLELTVKKVVMRVKWSKPKDDDPAVFRSGLEGVDPNDRIDIMVQAELAI